MRSSMRAWWAAAALAAAGMARAAAPLAPPPPEFSAEPPAGSEKLADTLLTGDPRRPGQLLALALARHRAALALEVEEREAHARALEAWRAAPRPGGEAPAPVAPTPRADAQRAEAVRLADRCLAEGATGAVAAQALLLAGLDQQALGLRKEALRRLSTLVRSQPESPLAADAWVALGEQHLAEGDLTGARAALESAARGARPAVRGWALARLAEVALQVGDPEGALDLLAQGLALGAPAAAAGVEGLASAPDRLAGGGPLALDRLVELCDRAGLLEQARRLAELAAAQSTAAAKGKGARALAGQREAEARAGRAAARAAALAPAGPPVALPDGIAPRRSSARPDAGPQVRAAAASGDAGAWQALGLAALDAGHAGEARELLERAVRSRPGGAPEAAAAENDLGVALLAAGDLAGARAAFGRAADGAPGWAPALQNLGAAALALADPGGAEPALARAVAQDPARWEPRLLLARAYAGQGREAEAEAEAHRVLDLAADQAGALALLASLRDAGGRAPAAPASAPARAARP